MSNEILFNESWNYNYELIQCQLKYLAPSNGYQMKKGSEILTKIWHIVNMTLHVEECKDKMYVVIST